MLTRVLPGVAPARPGQAAGSTFGIRVCEAVLPAGLHLLSVGGTTLPVPAPRVDRILVLGDSGCRIKQADLAFQDCTDPAAWPFASVARAAARERPDLVVHVGDYHYRESACPALLGCAHSIWGYGWDAWRADFFEPARPLLAAAPWVMVRGNHETCARAGQGWYRLLDPSPYSAARNCDAPAGDADADVGMPYAVPLGQDWQLVVFDSARASRALDPQQPDDARVLAQYRAQWESVDRLAAVPGMHTLFASHHPALGYSPRFPVGVSFGTPALLAPMHAVDGDALFPAGVMAALHGHVHTFEAINFSSDHPAALVTGQGGDNLDADLPASLPAPGGDAAGVQVDFVAHARGFGYLVMERAAAGWTMRAMAVDGTVIARCDLDGRHLSCPVSGPVSHAGAAHP